MSDHKSFLKWAGGKIKLLPKLRELGIESGERFIEPFVGSGVLSLNMPHPSIIVGDTNPALIALWCQIKDNPKFIECASISFDEYFNDEKIYYNFRDVFNDYNLKHWNEYHVASLFLYLNKHCFNGLCRFNAKGEFNVPYNHCKVAPAFPRVELEHAREVSKRMMYPKHCSFVDMFDLVQKGDMVFCDPPYLGAKDNGFTKYAKEGFSYNDHFELVNCAVRASMKGATVIICNNNVPAAVELYSEATETHFIDVQKNISCKGASRGKQSEIIAVYRP